MAGRSKLVGIILLTSVTFGCAAPAPTVGQPGAAAVQPQRGGVFQFAQRQTSPHLDPFTGPSSAQSQTLAAVYDPLVDIQYKPGEDFRKDYPMGPALAERWEQVDPTTYTFHLRKNVKWHDARDFTAVDVLSTFSYVLDPKVITTFKSYLTPLESFDAPDSHTVRIVTKGPVPTLLENLSRVHILPAHVLQRGDSYEKVAIGTGPFKMDSFVRDDHGGYSRHDAYWRSGRPYVDKIHMVMGMNDATQQAAFVSRKIDVITMQDKAQFDALQRVAPDVRAQPYLADITDSLYLKLDRPPFQDIRVRRAIHLALDRQDLVERLTYGLGGIDPPSINGAKEGWVIPKDELLRLPGYRQPKEPDRAEARRLLAEAGYPNGFKAGLKYVATYIGTPQGAEAVSEQLKAVGVTLELHPTEAAQFSQAQRDGNFDAYYTGHGRFQPEPSWRQYLHSKGGLNVFPVRDADLDRLIEAQDRELDVAKRKQLFIDIQRLMLDKLYTIPSFSAGIYAVWQPYVNDYVFNMSRQTYPLNWGDFWLDPGQVPSGR